MNKSKLIYISLFRVSNDSKSLDMIFGCQNNYYFKSLCITVCHVVDGKFVEETYDLSNALFADATTTSGRKANTRYAVSLPLNKLGIDYPAIYTAVFKIDSGTEQVTEEEDSDVAVCSDVNYAYHCMLKDLLEMQDLSSCNLCVEVSDDLIKKYLLVYGHQAALSCGDDEFAKTFFKIINNCFGNCPSTPINCGCASKRVTSCNCGK